MKTAIVAVSGDRTSPYFSGCLPAAPRFVLQRYLLPISPFIIKYARLDPAAQTCRCESAPCRYRVYNVVEKLRAGQLRTPKEQVTKEHGLAAMVLSLHQQLGATVAYGWPTDLPEADLLTRLVWLNHQHQQEEAVGQVRYLRPTHQAPDTVAMQSILALPTAGQPVASANTFTDLTPQM